MDPKECAEWIIDMHTGDSDHPPFEAMDDDAIIAMFLPLARAYLATLPAEQPRERKDGE